MGSSDYSTVGRSAGLMTILTIVSRVTGFIRTWAMAAAIGMSLLSSSYQVANNLPNMLYELVMGGMLVTAFLPVYMGVRREQGREASNEYVGNLLGILLLVLGGISLLGTVFDPGLYLDAIVLSGDGGSMDTAAFMFRFFAIQILFYGLGSVFSGVLNAHRDYFWSTFDPGPQQCDRHCELYGLCARVRTVRRTCRHHLDCGRYDPRCLCSDGMSDPRAWQARRASPYPYRL